MKIIEKLSQEIPLNPKELQQQKVIFLDKLADLKTILRSLSEGKQEQCNKILSLLLIYYPENWKPLLFKSLNPEVLDKIIKEENYFE
jgi:hypothetical protein